MRSVTLLSAGNVKLFSCSLTGSRADPLEPPDLGRSVLVCTGLLRITSTAGREIAYLHIGTFSHPLMPRTRVWRVNDRLIFGQPTPGRFWVLEIPFGRIDVILSQVCSLRPKVDVQEPLEEEREHKVSPAVLDAMETCQKRPSSVASVYSDERSPLHRSQDNEFAYQRANTSRDTASDSSMRFDDPDASTVASANTSKRYTYLDSDSDEASCEEPLNHEKPGSDASPGLGIQIDQSVSQSSPSSVLDAAFTPVRTSSLGAINLGAIKSPTKTPTKAPTRGHGSESKSPGSISQSSKSAASTAAPRSTVSTTPQTPPPKHTMPEGAHPAINGGDKPQFPPVLLYDPLNEPYKNEMMRTLEAILAGIRGRGNQSPSEENFGSPVLHLAKNPVFIATPTQGYTEYEPPVEMPPPPPIKHDELFTPDTYSISSNVSCCSVDSEVQSWFRHPLIPASVYPLDSDRPALRTKDLIRVGTHAPNDPSITTVGAFISWQMINRIGSNCMEPPNMS